MLREKIANRIRGLVASPGAAKGDHDAVVMAIASSKGGVGKTTSAVNLAVAFAQNGLRTLLIDLDPQCHVAASLHASPARHTPRLSEVLLGNEADLFDVVFPHKPVKRLHLTNSDKQMAETEALMATKIGKELILNGALRTARTHFELIIIDCPPNLGTLAINALCAADRLLIPSDMSILALEGVGDILQAVDTVRSRLGRPVEVAGILATRYDRRSASTNLSLEQSFVDLFGDRLLRTKIPQSAALNRAHMAGQPIFEHAPRSPGALAYSRAAVELHKILDLPPLTPPTRKQPAAGRRSAKPLEEQL